MFVKICASSGHIINSVRALPAASSATILSGLVLNTLAGLALRTSKITPVFFASAFIVLNGCVYMIFKKTLLLRPPSHPFLLSLYQNPQQVNDKIDYEGFTAVYKSHLLVSCKFFSEDEEENLDEVLNVIDRVGPYLDFSKIDESNLWQDVGFTEASGNNVLKSAVAAASASVSGKPERRKIVEKLLQLLQTNDQTVQKQILDQGDNFPLGAHTIPDFLVRQGNEDLALKAVDMGATIDDSLLLTSLASAGTKEHGVKLARRVVQFYVDHQKELDDEMYWKGIISLSALPHDEGLIDLLALVNASNNRQHWENIRYASCMKNSKEYNPFGRFSNQYRKDTPSPWDMRKQFIANPDRKKEFASLQELFTQIRHKTISSATES